MSLLPSSGFQSVQYRLVELACTSMDSLVHIELRPTRLSHSFEDVEAMFDELYWRRGATELATGKPTLTLKQFEAKYRNSIIAFAEERFHSNVRRQWQDLPESEQTPELRESTPLAGRAGQCALAPVPLPKCGATLAKRPR